MEDAEGRRISIGKLNIGKIKLSEKVWSLKVKTLMYIGVFIYDEIFGMVIALIISKDKQI